MDVLEIPGSGTAEHLQGKKEEVLKSFPDNLVCSSRFCVILVRVGLIVSRNYRMPIYPDFQNIEEYMVPNLQYRVSQYSQNQREYLGFHKQATHRRHDDEPFFSLWGRPFMTGDGLKMVHFGPKRAKHGRLVNTPKWSKRVRKGPKWST